MNSLPATRLPIPDVHQSGTPWLAHLSAGEVFSIDGTAAQRWLWVQSGSLWVTAALSPAGPVPREADIWLSAGDSLELPPGTAWLLQAWPTADMVLLERAAPRPAWVLPAAAARRPLLTVSSVVRRLVCWVRRLSPGSHPGTTGCAQRA